MILNRLFSEGWNETIVNEAWWSYYDLLKLQDESFQDPTNMTGLADVCEQLKNEYDTAEQWAPETWAYAVTNTSMPAAPNTQWIKNACMIPFLG